MTVLADYLQRADATKRPLLVQQWQDATEKNTVTCPCGRLRALTHAYRCLYCGLWFCLPCAETHFGQTVQQWIEAKRVEKRAALEQERSAK